MNKILSKWLEIAKGGHVTKEDNTPSNMMALTELVRDYISGIPENYREEYRQLISLLAWGVIYGAHPVEHEFIEAEYSKVAEE